MHLKSRKPLYIMACALVLAGSWAGSVAASEITSQTFDSDPVLSDTQAPGVWFTDRFAPAGFESESFMGDGRLAHRIAAEDGGNNRDPSLDSAFYNTQGRSFLTPSAERLSIDMYIADSFQTGRIGGLWGVGTTAGGDFGSDRTAFPIIEFIDGEFQVFDSIGGDSDGTGFRQVGTPSGFGFDQFVNLEIALDKSADAFDFLVNGELLHTEEAGGTQEIAGAILQNINTDEGVDRTIYFDNFVASTSIPVPSALAMFIVGLAGCGLFVRKR